VRAGQENSPSLNVRETIAASLEIAPSRWLNHRAAECRDSPVVFLLPFPILLQGVIRWLPFIVTDEQEIFV
jgi:hypothetical protein